MKSFNQVSYPHMARKVYTLFCEKMEYDPFALHDALWISSPGRVNLIGEHLDYNGGHVFPCALTMGITGLFCPRSDEQVRLFSVNFIRAKTVVTNIYQNVKTKGIGWGNYVMAIVEMMRQDGHKLTTGFDLVVGSSLPEASGLSSSAALELLVATALNEHFNLKYSPLELALLAQRAEREFIGVNCGIMDQYAVAMGQDKQAMFLDTATLECSQAMLNLGAKGLSLVIASSNKKRGLADSKYNERRSECEQALADLQILHPTLKNLCNLRSDEFELYQTEIKDKKCRARARHVVNEEERTKFALIALQANDFALFGRLMTESHQSLRDDYEVTGIELDTLVSSALKQRGVLGSRMTGAGFGGCTVTLVKTADMGAFCNNVGREYQKRVGIVADFYVAKAASGCHVLTTSPLK